MTSICELVSDMPSRLSQDISRVDETTSIASQQRPQTASSVSRSERSQNTPETQGTHSSPTNETGQLASLANKTPPSSPAVDATPQTTQILTVIANPNPTTGIILEDKPDKTSPLSPPLSPRAPSTPLSTRTGGYFEHQPAASGLEPRSPATRRPPASRSSNGIETSSGPPPALSTQRSHPTESPWKQPSPSNLPVTRPSASRAQTINSINLIVRLSQDTADEKINVDPGRAGSKGRRTSGAAEENKMLHSKRSKLEDDQDRTLRTLEGIRRTPPRNKYSRYGQEEEQSQSSHEDLFLNLAHTDAGNATEPLSRFERRRVS